MERNTKYVVCNKAGRPILESNSFWGIIGKIILTCILAPLLIMIPVGIIAAIASLF